jgi:hypothetical protein
MASLNRYWHSSEQESCKEAADLSIVGKQIAVPNPVQRGFNLPLSFDLGEMLRQQITKEIKRHRLTGPARKSVVHLPKQMDVSERRIVEQPRPLTN